MNSRKRKEDLLNDFIDDLNSERKPRVYKSGEFENEDETLFETIRAVKRSGESLELQKKEGFFAFVHRQKLKLAFAAVSMVIVFTALTGILQLPGFREESNIVHAIRKAYVELESYIATVEVTGVINGEVEYFETIDIKYEAPWKYKAVHNFNEVTVSYYSNGERLIRKFPNAIEVENVFPEIDLWRYHIGTSVWEIVDAEEVVRLDNEELLGREAKVIKYRYSSKEYNKIWIDAKTKLPLRKELISEHDNRSLVVEFKDLQINPQIDESVFNYDIEEDYENIRVFNNALSLEELKSEENEEVERILDSLLDSFEVFVVGNLENSNLYDYVIRTKGADNDYIDVYYSSNPSAFSYDNDSVYKKLKDGYVQIREDAFNVMETYVGESNILRWTNNEKEFFIVSNLNSDYLIRIIEDTLGGEVDDVSREEIQENFSPIIERDNH